MTWFSWITWPTIAYALFVDVSLASELSVRDYCKDNTFSYLDDRPIKRQLICPHFMRSFSMGNPYTCPDRSNMEHYEINKTITAEQYPWFTLLPLFIKELKASHSAIGFMGDSLSAEMYLSLLCMLASLGMPYHQHANLIMYERKWFFTNLSKEFRVNPNFAANSPGSQPLESEEWTEWILRNKLKYVVFNIGAWWSSQWVQYHESGLSISYPDILRSFRQHMEPTGRFMQLIKWFAEVHNVTFIWRDNAPSGVCDMKNPGRYLGGYNWELFQEMNSIARQSLHAAIDSQNVMFIEHIWSDSLPHWKLHINQSKPPHINDYTHFCLYWADSVPNLWNIRLMEQLVSRHPH